LIECVPNFSEGRNSEVIREIAAAMDAIVPVLDLHSDPDHNRTVITVAGSPEAVAEAALQGVGRAVQLIDLNQHSGVHPRIGAADVVPFVPVRGTTLTECVAVARRVGQQIWDRFRVPVYYYGAAALRPERAELENVRRGQFERLREEALSNPAARPDVGENGLHPSAGAVAVGARKFLIAYNINLATSDLEISRRIARLIRASSGGFPYVKAIGVALPSRSLVQVSLNLTDFEQIPVEQVYDVVRGEAQRCGVSIAGCEIVGLIPRRAYEMAPRFYERAENFRPDVVLETRLERVKCR